MVGPGMFDGLVTGLLVMGAIIGAIAMLVLFGLWHLITWLALHLTWSWA